LSAQRRAMLMRSIVAIEMTVETVEASFKLNQHKADADHVAVVRVLREHDTSSAQRLQHGWSPCGRTWRTNEQTDRKDLSHG